MRRNRNTWLLRIWFRIIIWLENQYKDTLMSNWMEWKTYRMLRGGHWARRHMGSGRMATIMWYPTCEHFHHPLGYDDEPIDRETW